MSSTASSRSLGAGVAVASSVGPDGLGTPSSGSSGEHHRPNLKVTISEIASNSSPDSNPRAQPPLSSSSSLACLDESVGKGEVKQPESLDIADFPTDKLLQMLTALLEKIIKSNDRLAEMGLQEQATKEDLDNPATPKEQNDYLRSVLSFRGKHVPQISLEQYFQRIQKYCPITNDVFLSLLVYFDRVSKKCNSSTTTTASNGLHGNGTPTQIFVMDSYNIHRLIIAGITVSTKFFSDFFYSNSRYARVGGISLQELNHLELQFLLLCDFQLLISVNELQRYANLLYRFWDNNSKNDTADSPDTNNSHYHHHTNTNTNNTKTHTTNNTHTNFIPNDTP